MVTTSANAIVPTMRSSFSRKVSRMVARLPDCEDLHPAWRRGTRDVSDRARMSGDEGYHCLVTVELHRGCVPAGENHLLPVAFHRGDRASKHLLSEAAPEQRVD